MAENDGRSLFGFQFKRKKIEVEKKPVSFAADNEDGAYEISPTGGYFGQYLIMKYRSVASYPEVDMAIEDICNEAITEESGVIAKLNLDNLDQAENVKELIMEEFDRILNLTNFSSTAYDIFRRWYVDGRLFYHCIINENKCGVLINDINLPIDINFVENSIKEIFLNQYQNNCRLVASKFLSLEVAINQLDLIYKELLQKNE